MTMHASIQEHLKTPGLPARPIRSLNRGLALLAAMNRLERATINTLAESVRLPRTTTYRILETLRLAGYLDRNAQDSSYQLTVRVRGLAQGFDDKAMVAHVAKPHLASLCTAIVWPVAISTPAGPCMMIRETTDYESPLALEHFGAGIRMPILTSAAGRTYLAYCTEPQREELLKLLACSSRPEDRLGNNRQEVQQILTETRTQGFGMARRARRVSEETSLAIPVRVKEQVMATLSVRYAATAVPLSTAVEQFLPKMRLAVEKIESELNLV